MKNILTLTLVLCTFLVFAACNNNSSLTEIKDVQKEILETQKEILAKVTSIEQKAQNVQAQPSRPAIDYNAEYNIPIEKSAFKGNKKAPITIIEFSDFQCPYCSQLQPTLQEVLKAYPNDVKFVFKHYPLSFHKQANNAAKATEAAREQGKFWEMHDLLFLDFNKLTDDSYTQYAKKLGLNLEKFKADLASNKYDELIKADIEAARRAGVTGTPTLFINGKRMQRRSFDDFKAEIDKISKK